MHFLLQMLLISVFLMLQANGTEDKFYQALTTQTVLVNVISSLLILSFRNCLHFPSKTSVS